MPTIELAADGEPTLMGRSGKSSHYQLSTNKLISRVHVRATYIPADPPNPSKVEVVCTGWNGVKVHCQGKAWELGKDSSFTSESQDADIMIDVQDARVLLQWPKLAMKANTPETDSAGDSENSPRRVITTAHPRSPFSSPLGQHPRLQSPVSPSPAVLNAVASTSADLFSGTSSLAPVQVYEDQPSDGEGEHTTAVGEATQSTQRLTQPLGTNSQVPQSEEPNVLEEFSDQDEENDPIVHSFGPFGANLLPRMASFTAGSSPPRRSRVDTIKQTSVSPAKGSSSESTRPDGYSEVLNHVINQLAYSRLSSTPLSIIMGNLPASLKNTSPDSKENTQLSMHALKMMIDRTQCIGEVCREGKDAAGKPLESEYYYIPDMDLDESRRDAVVDGLRKPGLRACRKQHKVGPVPYDVLPATEDPLTIFEQQYYWRKPK